LGALLYSIYCPLGLTQYIKPSFVRAKVEISDPVDPSSSTALPLGSSICSRGRHLLPAHSKPIFFVCVESQQQQRAASSSSVLSPPVADPAVPAASAGRLHPRGSSSIRSREGSSSPCPSRIRRRPSRSPSAAAAGPSAAVCGRPRVPPPVAARPHHLSRAAVRCLLRRLCCLSQPSAARAVGPRSSQLSPPPSWPCSSCCRGCVPAAVAACLRLPSQPSHRCRLSWPSSSRLSPSAAPSANLQVPPPPRRSPAFLSHPGRPHACGLPAAGFSGLQAATDRPYAACVLHACTLW
jgi:hypothetical protein